MGNHHSQDRQDGLRRNSFGRTPSGAENNDRSPTQLVPVDKLSKVKHCSFVWRSVQAGVVRVHLLNGFIFPLCKGVNTRCHILVMRTEIDYTTPEMKYWELGRHKAVVDNFEILTAKWRSRIKKKERERKGAREKRSAGGSYFSSIRLSQNGIGQLLVEY